MATPNTFDPFAARDLPVLKLGAHGEFPLLDLSDPMIERLQALQGELDAFTADGASVEALAKIVGRLAAGATDNDTLETLIPDLANPAKYGHDALGIGALRGCVDFIRAHIEDIASAGEA